MTTRSVALPHPYATPAAFLRRYFYFCMSLLIAVVVVYGFSHTIGHNLLHASPIPPFVLTIHAIVFPGWVLFFILQTALVRTHNVPLHRTLGWFGLAFAIGVLVVGYMTATGMDRFLLQQHRAKTPAFLIIQLMDLDLLRYPLLAGHLLAAPAGVPSAAYAGRLLRAHGCGFWPLSVPIGPLLACGRRRFDLSRHFARPHRRSPDTQGVSLRFSLVYPIPDFLRANLPPHRSVVGAYRRRARGLKVIKNFVAHPFGNCVTPNCCSMPS